MADKDKENGETAMDRAGGEDKAGAAKTASGDEVDFKDISLAEALKILECDDKGLTTAEWQKRLEQYGPNKLPESQRNAFLVFLGYMNNPLSWAMEAAAIISIVLIDYVDFILILSLLFCNATISFVEESNADKAIKALTSALAPRAKVIRDGEVKAIEAIDLVPGDVIVVRIGDIVPADIKLLGDEADTSSPLQVDQAALTGESLPVKKFPGHIAFSGSTIKQGEQEAVVYATGKNTFFGRAAALIAGTNAVANIQKIMTRIGAVCLITIGIWCLIELFVQFFLPRYGGSLPNAPLQPSYRWRHSCIAGIGGCATLTNMLVIIVGGIPIAMPTVLSVTLALGAARLAKEGAIVARMSAVEEMAGMSILCSDKTGTLTLNKLSVDQKTILPGEGYTSDDVMKYAALSAQINSEEAIDVVLVESYEGNHSMWNNLKQSKYIPFNPTDKFTIGYVTNPTDGSTYQLLKGAPQVVLRKSSDKEKIEKDVNDKIVEFANRGYRSLGIAKADGDSKDPTWHFVGLLPLFDPPRHDTKETIARCLEKGISVKMVTGDQLLIGKEVARQLGMGTNMYTTEVLIKAREGIIHLEGVNDVDELVEHADGFAEVFPEHKYAIVEILQQKGHLVGMTGDGVNDAPALKRADVGVAVAGATEAARGAADIVLTEAGLSTIVTAIIGARKIFQRMNTYAKYTVAMTFRICFTFGILTVVYDWYFPTLLIVLLAVFNDGAMIALSKDRVLPSELPNSWKLFNIFTTGIVYGIYLSLSSWVLFYVAAKTQFFRDSIHLPDLNQRDVTLVEWCTRTLNDFGYATSTPRNAAVFNPAFPSVTATGIYQDACNIPEYGPKPGSNAPQQGASIICGTGTSAVVQCMAEQKWMRESMLRSLLYVQVSISGQAVVFVVRATGWSLTSRAGVLTYAAFFFAQFAATIIGLFGFNGYDNPRAFVKPCIFCRLSGGGHHPFFTAHKAPQALTESLYTDSIIGCEAYVIVAWIWAFIWYLPLDPIKWFMAYVLNEDGFRDRMHGKRPQNIATETENVDLPSQSRVIPKPQAPNKGSLARSSAQKEAEKNQQSIPGGPVTWTNPMGRHSMSQVSQNQLERASVMSVHKGGPDGRSSLQGGK
ncbi:hypothetical protein WJX73_003965 [Symbiochloris irregularis]|uniref:Plasma membrane ATPase n=1 Tax=Symbiochloris irregularis TaxID=706552 RepID=A0AAW1NXL0_9CHLO